MEIKVGDSVTIQRSTSAEQQLNVDSIEEFHSPDFLVPPSRRSAAAQVKAGLERKRKLYPLLANGHTSRRTGPFTKKYGRSRYQALASDMKVTPE